MPGRDLVQKTSIVLLTLLFACGIAAGAKFAVLSAGGGFSYVGAMHDSFPHALELSKRGYHAFALIYRPDAEKACEDLARAIAFIHEHSRELEVDVRGYSLWGGSAGARMAAWLGSFGTERFGEKDYPRGAAYPAHQRERHGCRDRRVPRIAPWLWLGGGNGRRRMD